MDIFVAAFYSWVAAHKTVATIILSPIIVGLVSAIGFLIKHFFFSAPSSASQNSGIHSEGNFMNHGVIATSGSPVSNAVVGDQYFTFNVHTGTPSPTPVETKREEDKMGRQEVAAMMRREATPENKRFLLKKFRETEDRGLKVQIAHICGVWFDPLEDAVLELIEITTEAIEHAKALNAKPVQAALLGYKGTYNSLLFMNELIELLAKRHRGIGQGSIDFFEREMQAREKLMQQCFNEAERVANESGSYEAIAMVQIDIGQAAGNRAAGFVQTDHARSEREKELMRKSFSLAEKAYADVANTLVNHGELEIANVKHNLANCLRMFGKEEIEEAKRLESDVIIIAEKYGDSTLLWKAKAIMERLNGKDVPDYYNGEKGESGIKLS